MATDGIHCIRESWLSGLVPPDETEFLNVYKALSEARVKATDRFNPNARGAGKEYQGEPEFHLNSAMTLMSVLYAARVARFDLFKPIQFLAKRITKWDQKCDARLHQLMCYISQTVDYLGYGLSG